MTQKRKQQFKQLIDLRHPASEQFLAFHYSKAEQGQYGVNMQREDAMTVSISHIKVGKTIRFNYFDKQSQLISSISCLKSGCSLIGPVDLCGLKFVQTRGYLIAARDL